jgi:diguanylate cyclase (GGDEF)-like protein
LATHSEKVLHGLLLPEGDGTVLVADVVGESDDVAEQIGVLANEISNISRDLRQRNRELEEANRRITELSRTDALTGLANRRCFLERLTPALSVVARHEVDVSIIMADLDHFKNVNDTYGHEEGDRVLRAFADVLRAECRKEDLPGRFGGEEFIILLPHTVPSRGATVAERIRTRFANETSARCRAACTASFGVAAVTAQDTAESAIARADKALYAAKETGRNRTVVG